MFSSYMLFADPHGFSTTFSMGLHKMWNLPIPIILIIGGVGGAFSYQAGASFGGIIMNKNIYLRIKIKKIK